MGKIRRNKTKRPKSRRSGNRRPKACKKVHTNKKRKAARRRTFRKKCMKKCMKTYKQGGGDSDFTPIDSGEATLGSGGDSILDSFSGGGLPDVPGLPSPTAAPGRPHTGSF